MKVSRIRQRIVEAVGAQARSLLLKPCRTGCFAGTSRGVTRLLTVSFLDRRHAASFKTSTASFSLEVGVWYCGSRRLEETSASPPEHFECHVRHLLVRDFHQEAPSPSLAEPDKARRDIWWVSTEGGGLDQVLTSATAAVARQGQRFYSRFTRPKHAERYFTMWWLTHRLPGAPFNVGRPKSPSHQHILKIICDTARTYG